MAVDQVELLTREIKQVEESHPRDVKILLDSLPVKHPAKKNQNQSTEREDVRRSVATDAEEPAPAGEGPIIRALLQGLNWATFVLAMGAALFLTWAAGDGLMQYLTQK